MSVAKKNTAPVQLSAERKNSWNTLSAAEQKSVESYCKRYIRHISVSKTERQAHDDALEILLKAGALSLESVLAAKKPLPPNTIVYASQQGKTLLAARIGSLPLEKGLRLVGGHTDVPHLHLKPVPLYEDSQICLMDTHYYGGIKKYHWVAMPLALHGVIVKKSGETIKISIGEKPEDPVFMITDVLPHLAKEQRTKNISDAITGENLNALCGSLPVKDKETLAEADKAAAVKSNILRILNAQYGIDEKDFYSAELSLVPAGVAREVGFDRSMIAAFGHDDRICAYAGLEALLNAPNPKYSSVILLCDKEEIGSVSTTGMQSLFFENTMARLCALQYGAKYNDILLRDCLENSDMLSGDVSALHDPNWAGVSSPNNMAYINAGLVVSKYLGSGGKSGSNDASAEFMARIRKILDDANVIWQTSELGKVDEGGGGTIAIYMAKYGMNVVDCGVGLFSMHAPWEVAGKLDAFMAYKGYRAFLLDNR